MNREVYALLYSDSRYVLSDFEVCNVYSYEAIFVARKILVHDFIAIVTIGVMRRA